MSFLKKLFGKADKTIDSSAKKVELQEGDDINGFLDDPRNASIVPLDDKGELIMKGST